MSVATPERLQMHGMINSRKSSEGLSIKGFASMAGEDRHGHDIPPDAFDLEKFMANPQLWLNHDLYSRPGSETEVPVGVVNSAVVASVNRVAGKYNVVDDKTGETIETLDPSEMEGLVLNAGDRGLWVTASVMEPEVTELISDGRLNAFSWAGMLKRSMDGTITDIDIREVSLVFLPANAKALFTVGKSFFELGQRFVISGDGNIFPFKAGLKSTKQGRTPLEPTALKIAALTAERTKVYSPSSLSIVKAIRENRADIADFGPEVVAVFSYDPSFLTADVYVVEAIWKDGVWSNTEAHTAPPAVPKTKGILEDTLNPDERVTLDGNDNLTPDERDVVNLCDETTSLGGGDFEKMTKEELMEVVKAATKDAADTLTEQLKGLGDRLTAIETAKNDDPPTVDAEADTPVTDEGAETPAPEATPDAEADAEAAPEAGGDAEDTPAEADTSLDLEGVTNALKEIVGAATAPINDAVKALGDRMSKLESTPAVSKATRDTNVDTDPGVLVEQARKKLDSMDESDRKKFEKALIGNAILPVGGFNRP